MLCLDFPAAVRFSGDDILAKRPDGGWRSASCRAIVSSRDMRTAAPAIQQMSRYCPHASEGPPGPQAGELRHWRNGNLQRITGFDQQAEEAVVHVGGFFASAWPELA